jgi:hypothetical protein
MMQPLTDTGLWMDRLYHGWALFLWFEAWTRWK